MHTKIFSGCQRQELEILGLVCWWKVQLGSCGLERAEILTISGNRGHLEIISDEYTHTNTNTNAQRDTNTWNNAIKDGPNSQILTISPNLKEVNGFIFQYRKKVFG